MGIYSNLLQWCKTNTIGFKLLIFLLYKNETFQREKWHKKFLQQKNPTYIKEIF